MSGNQWSVKEEVSIILLLLSPSASTLFLLSFTVYLLFIYIYIYIYIYIFAFYFYASSCFTVPCLVTFSIYGSIFFGTLPTSLTVAGQVCVFLFNSA